MPRVAAEAWNCGVTCVFPLGPHPELWRVLVCRSPQQRPDPHTKGLTALRPLEEVVDILIWLQVQSFLVTEDAMG